MRQPSDDRALYYRQLRDTVRTLFLPELNSAQAKDAAGLVDRILVEFIVEEEAAPALSAEFGGAFAALLEADDAGAGSVVTPARFGELRARAAAVVANDARSADARSLERARKLVEVEHEFLERVDELRRAQFVEEVVDEQVPSINECSVTNEQIAEYLRHRLSNSPDVVVERASVVPGGRSKETILVALSGTDELPGEVILRKDRPVGLLQTQAADEFAVIKAVHDFGGVPIPEPFFAERADHGLGDGTFLVMERVRGHKAGEFFPDLAAPTEYRKEIGLHLAAALARLHSVPLDRLTETNLGAGNAVVTADSIVASVDGIVARIDELSGPPCAAVPLARQWLVDNVSDVVAASELCLLQGDFGFHNMLVDGPTVTALVDWEAATIGPPARELAAAWSAATTLIPWPDFVAAYIEAGGSPVAADPRAVAYYRVLSALGGFMASRTGGHMFRTGAKRDLLTAHSGIDSHFRCARNLSRALGDAIATS